MSASTTAVGPIAGCLRQRAGRCNGRHRPAVPAGAVLPDPDGGRRASLALQCALAGAAVLAATWLRLWLDPALGHRASFITYFPAIIGVAIWCRLGPAVLAWAASVALVDWCFLPPVGSFAIADRADRLQLVLYTVVSGTMALVARAARAAQMRAEHDRRELDARQRELDAILEALPVGLAITRDLGGATVQANAMLRGLIEGGRLLRDGEPVPAEALPLRRAAREGRPVPPSGFDAIDADGRGRHLMVSALPLRDAGGGTVGAVAVAVDVTESRATAQRLGLALRAGRMAAWAWDPQRDQAVVTDGAGEVFGFPPGATTVTLAQGLDLLLPEDRARHRGLIDAAITTGAPYRSVFRVRRPVDGRVAWLEERAEASRDPLGRLQLVGVVSDITALKEREQALAASEARHRGLVDGAHHIIWSCTADGAVDFVNDAWVAYTGLPREAAGVRQDIIHPDDLPAMEAQWSRSLAEGSPWTMEYRLRRADGAWRWWHGRCWPVRDGAGAVREWHGMGIDIQEQRDVREALRRSEAFARSIVESSTDCIKVLDDEARILEMNAGGLRSLGLDSLDPVRGRRWPEFWAPADRDRAEAAIAAARAGGVGRFRGALPDGRWWDVLISPIEGGGRLLAVSREVSDEVAAAAALRESEARFRDLADGLPDLVWTLSVDGRFSYVNRRWTEYTGLDLVATRAADMAALIHPEDAQRVLASWAAALAAGEAYEVQFRLRRADGAFRWYLARAWPRHDHHGRVPQWIGSSTDVHDATEARLAVDRVERDLRRSERFFRLKIEQSPFPTFVADRDGRIVLVNAAHERLFGIGMEQLADLDVRLPRDGRLPPMEQAIAAAYAGRPSEIPVRAERIPYGPRAGETVWIRSFIYPLTTESGVVEEVVFIQDDLSDLQLARQRLERQEADLRRQADELLRSNSELEQFAYVAAHDLQEPIRMIVAFLELAERALGPAIDARARGYFATAVDGALRMREMVASILEYSRIGREGVAPGPSPLDRALATARANLAAKIRAAGAVIEAGPLPVVEGIAPQLARLLQNLIANAITFRGDEPPCVRVEAAVDGPWHVVSVHDNGIGIDPEDAGRLFTLFQRLHPATRYPGTGIGLASCRKIVEGHGGRIWFAPRPGGGTTFAFTLPRGTAP